VVSALPCVCVCVCALTRWPSGGAQVPVPVDVTRTVTVPVPVEAVREVEQLVPQEYTVEQARVAFPSFFSFSFSLSFFLPGRTHAAPLPSACSRTHTRHTSPLM
jgi:hypothetical protein